MDANEYKPLQRVKSNSLTLEQLRQAKPYAPNCQSEDFLKAKLLTDELLERAGAVGMTVPELRAKGCGERPPNRIYDLRRDGQAIVTRREKNRVTRYIKAKFLPKYAKPEIEWSDRPRVTGLPLWDLGVQP